MNDEQLKREIEEALAAEPSPQFVARVRRRLANEPRPSIGFPWTWMAAGLATAAVLVGIVVFQPWPHREVIPERIAVDTPPSQTVADTQDPTRVPAQVPTVGTQVSTRVRPAIAVSDPQPRSTELEVLLDPREVAAFKSFFEDIEEMNIDPSKLEALFAAADQAGTLTEPMPIAESKPIEIKPLMPAAEKEKGGESL